MKKYESLKKVDLHCHLEGSLNLGRVSKWTKKSLVDVENELILKKSDPEGYKNAYAVANSLLQTKTKLKEAATDLVKDFESDTVIYAEVRLDPVAHTKKGLTIKEVVETVLEGFEMSTVKVKLILMMKRDYDFETNKAIIDLAHRFAKKGVCAVDLAGDEKMYPTKLFKELFLYAKELNVPFAVHAGTTGDFKNIDHALSYGASRIGHGLKAITSYETMEKLKKLNVPLEICVSANVASGLYEKVQEHPVQRLIDSGVSVVIGTDDRTIARTTLTDEYILLNKHFGLTIKEFNEMNRSAIEHAFLNDKEKKELLLELQ